jgi:hypothetical protein
MRSMLCVFILLIHSTSISYVLQLFQQPIADSEWGLIVLGYGDKKRKDTIQRAMERRLDADKKAKDKKPKKVDYLGDMVSSFTRNIAQTWTHHHTSDDRQRPRAG